MKKTLSEDNTKLKDSFNKILLLPEYKKYEKFDFDFTMPFTKKYNQEFLKTLTPIQFCFSKVVWNGVGIIVFYPEIVDKKSKKTEEGDVETTKIIKKGKLIK